MYIQNMYIHIGFKPLGIHAMHIQVRLIHVGQIWRIMADRPPIAGFLVQFPGIRSYNSSDKQQNK